MASMWRDPMDELIEDLERMVPEPRRPSMTANGALDELYASCDRLIRQAEAHWWGEPEPSEAERQAVEERASRALRCLLGSARQEPVD